MNRRVTAQAGHHPRRGFTLIEMMLVIAIIALLAAMLLPAIQSAQTTARNAAVRSEISQLEAAIANFKATYGVEPPSGITICTNETEWGLPANAVSKTIISRIWPNFQFGTGAVYPTAWTAASYTLNGSECLAFFLGGIVTGGAPQGFSKNPTTPFAYTGGETRQGPFFEFQPNRLKETPVAANKTAGFQVYFDSLPGQTNPYLYLSSYEGRGYLSTDIPLVNGTSNQVLPGPYRVASGGSFHKAKSFQIISPGMDGEFSSTTPAAPVLDSSFFFDPNQPNGGLGQNLKSYDNITNLASGRLAP